MTAMTASQYREGGMTSEERMVIFASSLGTVFEWYDFYIYGTLAPILAAQFFSGVNPTAAFIFTLLAFAAGFAVRPFGALFFGRLGDLVGRKYTFIITMTLMGVGTFFIGLLPSYASVGIIAPIILIGLRLAQGLALGGEYGGAAIYVCEHAPRNKRGFYTSWIQTTATLGLFMALLLVLGIRTSVGEAAFVGKPEVFWAAWRIPFLLSAVLLAVSIWIRLRLNESPVFQRMKAEGKGSKRPLTEAFGNWANLKIAILALFGATAGEAVIWYGGQFYALFFLTQTLKVPAVNAQIMIAVGLLLGTPFFIIFGWLPDKIGRKPIILAGFALGVITYFPIFQGITHFANPKLEAALSSAPVTVVADPSECSFQFNPVGTAKFTSSCDIAKSALVARSVNYQNVEAPKGTKAVVKIGDQTIATDTPNFAQVLGQAITTHGYPATANPATANPADINYVMTVMLLTILVIYVTLVYAPIAAWLVELFPTRIRYSGLSLPYHIGNGWFGGFLPATVFAIVAATGNIYSGLWYPIVVAAMSFVVGLIFLPETKDRDITHM
jgi:Sugar (and other) transporter